jgi:hypothetical protein
MSRQAVRAEVASWFAPPAVQGLSTVFRAAPTFIDGEDWAPIQEGFWGATAYVHIHEHSEQRIALGGPTGGIKQVTYQMALVLMFRWVVPDGAGAASFDGRADGWADAFDSLVDNVSARIRQDRTFNVQPGGSIWQVGEGRGDLKITTDLPKIDDGQVVVWTAFDFEVIEMVAT